MLHAWAWGFGLLATMAWVAGCGRGSSVPISEGTVTLDGQPLPNVAVDLVPLDEAALPINGTVSDDAGRFRLRSRGVGRHTVVVTDGGRGAAAGRRRVPQRYTKPGTSPLEVVLPLGAPLILALEGE